MLELSAFCKNPFKFNWKTEIDAHSVNEKKPFLCTPVMSFLPVQQCSKGLEEGQQYLKTCNLPRLYPSMDRVWVGFRRPADEFSSIFDIDHSHLFFNSPDSHPTCSTCPLD
jgi:hypothetical protein